MISLIKALTLSQDELDQYYVKKRKQIFDKTSGEPKWLCLHSFLHWLIVPWLGLLRKSRGIKLTVCCDERKAINSPVIYACTHIGGLDVETIFEVLKKPAWLFIGNPREVYKNINGILLSMNGMIGVELNHKEDRYIAKETAVGLLKKGGSLIIFPEGAWNTSDSLPVMELFSGTGEIAIRTKAEIIPVAIACYGKHMYAAVGENMDVQEYSLGDKHDLTAKIRDTLATLKWSIYEKGGIQKRSEIPPNYRDKYISEIFIENNPTSYTLQEAIETQFVNRYITLPEDAFAHLSTIHPTMQNAFLFNKRLK